MYNTSTFAHKIVFYMKKKYLFMSTIVFIYKNLLMKILTIYFSFFVRIILYILIVCRHTYFEEYC